MRTEKTAPLTYNLERVFWAPLGDQLEEGPEALLESCGVAVARASAAAVFSCGSHVVTIDLVDREGVWEVSRLEIRAGEEGDVVASGFRRRLPLSAMVAELKSSYLGALRANAADGSEPKTAAGIDFEERAAVIEKIRESRRGRALTDEHFDNVAKLYRQRVHFGSRTPNKDLAAELDFSTKTVANWVGEARNRGFLTRPSKPGVAEA